MSNTSNTNPAREELAQALCAEIRRLTNYKPGDRVDPEAVGLLDVLYAYRLFLGRWPEFQTAATLRDRGGVRSVTDLMMEFLHSPEFQIRIPELFAVDMIVMNELPDGLRLFFNLKDRQAMRIAAGIHELPIQQAILSVLKGGMNCVDAGAHIGLYSMLMGRVVGRQRGKVYSFEPFPSTWQLFARNIRENQLDNVIVAYNAACHATPGQGRIIERDHEDLGESFVKTEQQADGHGQVINLVRVDDIVPPNVPIHVIKIDIEGSEPAAMKGMKRILTRDRPIIFTEFNPKALEKVCRVQAGEYLDFLKNHGYRCREVQDFLGNEDREYQYRPGDQTTNLVCEAK